MDDAKLANLLSRKRKDMETDPHLKGHPQVAMQHKAHHYMDMWRLLRDAERL